MDNCKLEKKSFLKYYLYEFLNGYIIDSYLGRNNDIEQYRKDKIKGFLTYLKIGFIPPSCYNLIYLVSPVQVFLSIIIVLYRYVYISLLFVFTEKETIEGNTIIFNIGDKTLELLNKTDIDISSILLAVNPYGDRRISGVERDVSILSGITYRDIYNSFVLSIHTIFVQYKKYHNRDVFFRSYASFDFYLCCYFASKLEKSNSVIFTSTFARWAHIFTKIKAKKIFVQHGIIGDKSFTIRLGKIDVGYFIDESQKQYCEKHLFTQVLESKLMKRICLTEKYTKNDGRKKILLVCAQIYMDKQIKIIRDFQSKLTDVELLVKPHPKDDPNLYVSLLKNYKFTLILTGDNPRVDLLISYLSTLVSEYEAWGIYALTYDSPNFEIEYHNLIENPKLLVMR